MVSVIMMAAFLLLLIGVGTYSKRFITSADDFLLAGRELGTQILVFGVVASGFAGTTLTLAPGLGVRIGFWGTFAFAFFYAIAGVGLYAVLFAKTARRSGAYTLPEWLQMRYDAKVRTIVSVLAAVGLCAFTANNTLALANVISGYFEWNLNLCIVIGLGTVLIFTWCSGMWGISMTDFIQAGIGIVGAPILIATCISKFGGIDTAIASWGGGAFNYFAQGVDGTAMTYMKVTYPSMLTLGLNFSIFLVWGGQHYWMKVASGRSEEAVKKAYIIGGVLLFFITMIIGMVGLYAGAVYPEQFTSNGGTLQPESAYGFIINKFPSAAGSFLMIFALAASLSTAATNLMGAVSMVTKDVYQRFINKNADTIQLTKASRRITLTITAIALVLAFYPGGTAFLFAFASAWMAPGGILVALGIYWRRITNAGAWAGAVCGTIFMSIWAAMNLLGIPFLGRPVGNWVHLSVIGILTTLIPAIVVSLFTRPKYYGEKSWDFKGENMTEIDFTEEDKTILSYIYQGYTRMSELMDITGWAGEHLNQIIEKLDVNHYIHREGLTAEKFWGFSLSEKGRRVASQLKLPELKTEHITAQDVEILSKLELKKKTYPGTVVEGIVLNDKERREYAVAVLKLIRCGYIHESGFLRREITLTEKGDALVKGLQNS